MKLTAKCVYAIIALTELTKYYQVGYLKSSEISSNCNIPERFLDIVLNDLKNSGIIDSKRGAKGGSFLKIAPEKLTVYDVVKAIDGEISIIEHGKFLSENIHVLDEYFDGLKKTIVEYLKSTSLKDLTDSIKKFSAIIAYEI